MRRSRGGRAQLRGADPAELAAAACGGDRRAVARLLSLVEDGDPKQLRAAAEALVPAAGKATPWASPARRAWEVDLGDTR